MVKAETLLTVSVYGPDRPQHPKVKSAGWSWAKKNNAVAKGAFILASYGSKANRDNVDAMS